MRKAVSCHRAFWTCRQYDTRMYRRGMAYVMCCFAQTEQSDSLQRLMTRFHSNIFYDQETYTEGLPTM